jgi:hypothetical protein
LGLSRFFSVSLYVLVNFVFCFNLFQPAYVAQLSTILNDQTQPEPVRQQAGLQLKNELASNVCFILVFVLCPDVCVLCVVWSLWICQSPVKQQQLSARWLAADDQFRSGVKQGVSLSFCSSLCELSFLGFSLLFFFSDFVCIVIRFSRESTQISGTVRRCHRCHRNPSGSPNRKALEFLLDAIL